MTKFKPISSSETIYCEDGLATNRIWLFNMAWIESVKNKSNLQLRNRVLKARAQIVAKRMKGFEHVKSNIAGILNLVDLKEFYGVRPSEFKTVKGYKYGNASQHEIIALKINNTHIDIDFATALYWDKDATILVRGALDPVVIVKNGAIVGMICPYKFNK